MILEMKRVAEIDGTGGQNSRGDRMSPPERELRAEIDDLRLQIQQLRMELVQAESFTHLVRHAAKDQWRKFRERLHLSRKKVERVFADNSHNIYGAYYNPGFKPYQARIRHLVEPRRPRVVHFIGNFLTGGSSQLVVDLFEHLGHRYEQQIITKYLPDPACYVGIDIVQKKEFKNYRQVLSLLSRIKPDLIHIHYALNTNSMRGWFWYHPIFQAAETYGGKVIENINILVDPYVSDGVRRYVYVSDYIKHRFGRLDGPNLTIYPGSDFKHFERRDEANLPNDCIGMVYRLDPGKLSERSIDPFIEVARRRKGTKALIVGGGSYTETYREAARKAGVEEAFTFTGYVSYEDLPSYIERMSLFVAPVEIESFGQVTPFAMGMGLPVAAYDKGPLSEILGSGELLAPAGDSSRLADIIIDLLDDRERRLRIGKANRQRAHLMFSLEAMADRYASLYDEVLQSG